MQIVLLTSYLVVFLFLFWCPYMVINVVVSVQYNGGFLPEIILLTLLGDYIGEPF